MKLDAQSVQEYFQKVPEERKAGLQQMRELIITHAPEATEIFKYNLPFYPMNDEPFISLASQKHHVSFYLNEPDLILAFKDKLGKVDLGKNCIRFRRFDQVDLKEFGNLIRAAHAKRIRELSQP